MSRFAASSSGIKLDAAGNIDTGVLEKELRSALDFDIKYKQTDNMKKKACKVSGTYDEFKAMVACAHLKTLTSKEVQSLATAKKGWQKSHVTDTAAAAVILQQEQREIESVETSSILNFKPAADFKGTSNTSTLIVVSPTLSFSKPKNGLALERDLKKLSDSTLRWSYLQQVGVKRIKTLLKGDAGIDVFEQVLLCLMSASASASASASTSTSSPVGPASPASEETGATLGNEDIFVWLKAVSSFERFSVSVHFVPRPLLIEIQEWLTVYSESCGDGAEEVQQVLNKFQVMK